MFYFICSSFTAFVGNFVVSKSIYVMHQTMHILEKGNDVDLKVYISIAMYILVHRSVRIPKL